MKHHFQKKAKYTALILASSLPFSAEVLADVEKKQIALESLSITDKNCSLSKNNVLAENNQQVINETRDFLSSTQQALIALEKNDTKAALAILQDLKKNLPVFLDKTSARALALVTAEMEADILDFEGNVNTVKKELKQIEDLLDDETLQQAFLSVPFYKRLKNSPTLIDA